MNHAWVRRVFPVGGIAFAMSKPPTRSGAASLQRHRHGPGRGYFDGDIKSVGFSSGRLELTERFSFEPAVSVNWIDSPRGGFRTDLVVSRASYSFTPRMFLSGLVQYNSAAGSLGSNIRLRWEYSPGSELFVVYTEDRDTDPLQPDRFSELRNRGLVIKINRLFRSEPLAAGSGPSLTSVARRRPVRLQPQPPEEVFVIEIQAYTRHHPRPYAVTAKIGEGGMGEVSRQ